MGLRPAAASGKSTLGFDVGYEIPKPFLFSAPSGLFVCLSADDCR